MLVALLVLSLLTGYRRGATLQVIGLIGLAVGVVAGVLLAPRVATLASSPSGAIALAMGTVLIGGAIGNLAGWVIGSRIRPRNEESSIRRVDAVGGSAISAIALLLATWFIALNLANGPFPGLARGIRDSRIVRTLDSTLPPPPSIVGEAAAGVGIARASPTCSSGCHPNPRPRSSHRQAPTRGRPPAPRRTAPWRCWDAAATRAS